ncbi:glycosyltransferase [Massilia pseudoviolaceinigra]|uniref:glycosyltransferase n=1 Tax=Massilia pseudoviolaceinigra TaxID=3057165 RepID=UPI002796C4DA|nr:glycosyltransferase [Massilia sp. CCM 9206]MDQ1918953.1 glycosyltransferase [Massilia sp. CCM 9206]
MNACATSALPHNTGLGNALNCALNLARAPLIACLPSDDVFYREHLATLCAALHARPDAVLAYAGVRHHYNREADGLIAGTALQLVQCMYRRSELRWTDRDELESDDLERLFWGRLRELGPFTGTGQLSCEWTSHPAQRHKLMQEPVGGINPFRQHYRVREPLRFHTTAGNAIDEVAQYHAMRARPSTPAAGDGLNILLAGELAYNADRVLALEERGHTLHGLWMREPYWYNTVGPLPFGHVRELPSGRWREALGQQRPDIIHAQLNWQAVPFCHQLMLATPGVPFVWHFKEGPFICLEKGTWPQLVDLFELADGCIFSSPEMRDWFDTVLPGLSTSKPCHVLDGDLPKASWFGEARTRLLSAADGGEFHTVVPGRPIGLHPHTVGELAAQGIHLHFYGDFTQGQWRQWIADARGLAPRHLHLHANVDQSRWVEEFSRYDAGWLHAFASSNDGELRRANWDDLNYPARMATLAAAGLPMIQRSNEGAIVATQSLSHRLGTGLFYDSIGHLGALLRDRPRMDALREQVWSQRAQFTFDAHVPELVAFFRRVIAAAGSNDARRRGPRIS